MACRHLRLLYHVMEGPTALVKLRHYLLGKRCDSRAERCTALTADDDTNSITRREYLGLRSHPDKVCIFQAADDDMNIIYTKDVNTIFTTKSSYTLTNLHQSYNR